MTATFRRARRTTPSFDFTSARRLAFFLPLLLALGLSSAPARAGIDAAAPAVLPPALLPDEAPLSSAQPDSPVAVNPEPLGQVEEAPASAVAAPRVAITCNGAGGLWSAPGTWSPSGVPTGADSVTINGGCTVTIDTAAAALSVVVQSGGLLEYDSALAQTLAVTQSVTVDAGGILRTPAAGTVTTHVLSVGTDLVNNGTLDFSTNGNTAGAGITFTGAGNNSFSGAGATTNLRTLTVNKGTSYANTLELAMANLTVQGTTTDGAAMAFLTLTNGTLKISGTFTMDGRLFTAAAYTIPATGGIWLNNPNFTVSGQNASPTNNGLFRLTAGTYNVGTAAGNSMGAGTGAAFVIAGGTLNVAGRLNSSSTFVTYTQSGGTVNVSTVGNASSSTPSFGFTSATGTVMNISGGTINLVQACTGATPVDYNQAGTMFFTGGTLNVGTGATATNFVFRIQGQMPAVVIDNTTNNKTANLSGQGNVWGDLTINPGTTLNLNPGTQQTLLMIGPTLTNNGAIVVNTNNTGTVNFAGTLQQVGAPYAQSYTGTGTCGTGALRVGTFSAQSQLGVTISLASPALNINRINAFYGPITNSGQLAVGAGDAIALVVQRGATGISYAAGSLDVAPTYNIGAGGLTLVYAQSATALTTGPEVPASRSVLSLQLLNPTGLTVAGGAVTCTGATNCLLLSGGTLTTDAANLFTVGNTAAASLAGGSAASYVNGPLARTLPASLAAAATYTFPVGKGSFKMLELVNPTTNAGGTVVVQAEVFDASSGGTAGVGFSALNTDRYWSALITAGAGNFTNATVRLTEQGTPAISAIGQSATQAGAYDSIGGTVTPPTIGPSSVVATLGYFAVGTLSGSTTICGNYNVFAAAVPPDFTTLTAAVAALNSRLMTCAVSFTLTDNVYAAETYPIILQPNGGASATNTLTIKPGPGATPAFSGTSAGALLVLNGADWVTIDGSNTVGGTSRNMSLQNTGTGTTSAVIWGQTVGTGDPATHNTIKNLTIAGNASTTTLAGVGFGSSTIGSGSLGTLNNFNRVQNNAITAVQFGVYTQGASSAVKNTGTVITGNLLGGAGALVIGRAGILVGFDDGTLVTNNTVAGVGLGTGSFDVFGIALGSASISNSTFSTNNDVANVTVTGNVIGPVFKSDTFSAAGISMGPNNYGTSLIANNAVYGVLGNGTSGDFCVGIYVGNTGTANSTTRIYYNSVSMTGNRDTGSATSQPAFALAVLGANPRVDIRDNALYNTSTAPTNGGPGGTAGSYAIGLSSTPPFNNITSNYNDLYTSGAASHFAMAGSLSSVLVDLPTLTAWQATVGKDANSISLDPLFSSTTLLQPQPGTPLVGAGTPVTVTVDITGAARSVTTPTIGAWETAADVGGPVINYLALGNTTSTANRTLAITVTDLSGVPTAGIGLPVLYFRKGIVGAYSPSQCVFVSGASYDCTFDYSLVGGVVTGDTIQYFVAAQDIVGNVAVNPSAGAGGFTANPPAAATPPTSPNSYLISAAVSGTKTLCASGCDYTTLTAAGGLFSALNAGVATGNIVVEIGGDLVAGEDGAVALNPLAEEPAGSNYTVTIYPVGAPRLITSTTAPTGGFIRLNGADRVTIDGSIGGVGTDRSLTITDTNTGTSSAVVWLQSNGADGATGNTLRNLVVVGNSNTTTFIGIGSGGAAVASLGTDNDNNRIENCDVRKAQFGIAVQGASAANKNTGTVIARNLLTSTGADSLGKGGIIASFEDGIQIRENAIGGIVSTTSNDVFGISLGGLIGWANSTTSGGSEVTNATVTRNSIGAVEQTNTYSAAGILVTPTTTGTNLIANNFISGVLANGTSPDFGAGIFVIDSGADSTTRIYANSVSMTGTLTGATQHQYALAVNGTNPILDVRDNILLNTQATGSTNNSYAVGLGYSAFGNLTSDFNDLFVPAAGNFRVGRTGNIGATGGTDAATLADWQAATAQDADSLGADPLFVSATDLHLQPTSPAINAGTPLAAVTVDFDGEPRDPVTPEIGADEVRKTDLAITKTDGVTTVVPGGSVTYTITAANPAGPDAVVGGTVTDTFDAALSCTWTCAGAGGGTCSPSGAGNIADPVNLPIGGSVTYTAACLVSPAASGTLANTATVTGPNFDPDTSNNSATDTDTLTPQADLGITKTDGVTSVTPGDTLTYTISAANVGPSDAPASTVADAFPAVLSCTTTCVGSGGGTCTPGPFTTNINDTVNLPVGGSVTYTSVCLLASSATGSVVNTATVTAAGGITDPVSGNDSATDTDTIVPLADLTITKTDGVTLVEAGQDTTYTIVAANVGPADAPAAAVIDIFPAACTSASWTCVGAGGGTCSASGSGNINQTVNLPVGGSVTFTAVCSVSATATGSLYNTASIGVGAGDPDPANNTSTDVDTIVAPGYIFADGFESGDTSQWSVTVPFDFRVYAAPELVPGAREVTFDYDFAALPSGVAMPPSSIAAIVDAARRPVALVRVRRASAGSELEWTLEVTGSGRSSWVPVAEVRQQVRLEWSAADQRREGHVAVWLDGRLALWVDGYVAVDPPVAARLLHGTLTIAE